MRNDLYDDVTTIDANQDDVLWHSDKIEIQRETKYQKNEFLEDLDKEATKMNVGEIRKLLILRIRNPVFTVTKSHALRLQPQWKVRSNNLLTDMNWTVR